MRRGLILLTGATGYVGGLLLRRLEHRGEPVRCLVRRPGSLTSLGAETEVVVGDVLDRASLRRAMEGVDVAYYLVHSLDSRGSFERDDRIAAENFAHEARAAGVRRIVYLGGLGAGQRLSSHLSSRQEVGRILSGSGVPTLELRASIVIGSGSLSFEMVRALVERLPVMITPRWVRTMAQPIAVDDVLAYLLAALDSDLVGSHVFEIGGTDRVSYEDLMREYARQAGLRRLMIRVPLLTPRLSSLWLGLVTPLHARVGRKLIDSLPHETVVQDDAALSAFPVEPVGHREAIAQAIRSAPHRRRRFVDSRSVRVAVPPERAFEPIGRLGGETGWYFANSLWRLRGSIDLLAGGVGLRRGRRGSSELVPGATVDFWRVEAVEPGRRLLLRAEMKLPGEAWLEFEVAGDGVGSTIRQTATFDARGLAGAAYWYALYPFHRYVFRGMARALADAAEARQAGVQSLEREQLVPRPLDEVFAFFADAANLEAITPPTLRFRLLTPSPIEMRQGTTIDYALRLRGLPIRWRSEIVTWKPGCRFVDIQRRGPYALWEHTHEFSPVDGGTLVRDRVRYRLPLGRLGALAHGLVRRDLERIFDHRQTAIGRLLAPHRVVS